MRIPTLLVCAAIGCSAIGPLAGCRGTEGEPSADGGSSASANSTAGAVDATPAAANDVAGDVDSEYADDLPDADNTAVNARDRQANAPTPLDQGQGQADVSITAKIRSRVVEQELSLNAHNVKIITQNGQVTLRGPVKTAAEKEWIERVAREVAGPENVTSLLEVERN